MIDSSFIIDYTNALYSTPAEYMPEYTEFRDMFSRGQIHSKEWVIKELRNLSLVTKGQTCLVVGAWYGTLGLLIKKQFPELSVTMLDIDPRCEHFIKNIIYNDSTLSSITADMYLHNYTENIVINTSCEHIPDIKAWIALLPECIVVLQSNNFIEGNGHINCVNNTTKFIEQTGLTDILYTGELVMPMYTRFMIIARVNKE